MKPKPKKLRPWKEVRRDIIRNQKETKRLAAEWCDHAEVAWAKMIPEKRP